MNFTEPLEEAERITLREMFANHPSPSVRMRAHAVLLSEKGFQIKELAEIFDKCRQTVSGWITSWRRDGLTGLFNASGGGRSKTLTEEEEKTALEIIKKKEPRRIKTAVPEIEKLFKKKISVSVLKKMVKRYGLSRKRIKKILKNKRDPKKFGRVKNILAYPTEKESEGEMDLYYSDESGFTLDPYIPYAWQPEGENIEIPSSKSGRINVLGFLSRNNPKFESFVFEGSVNSEVVISCSDSFSEMINKKTCILIDNAPMHRSKAFIKKISEWGRKGMFIIFNCTYSPELNIIEILRRKIKYEWMPFSAYESYKKLKSMILFIHFVAIRLPSFHN